MDLKFNKQGTKWVAEFEATSDFNLHIEKERGGIYIQQKSVREGKWDSVKNLNISPVDEVLEYGVIVPVPPMFVRIVSEIEPTMAVITFAQ